MEAQELSYKINSIFCSIRAGKVTEKEKYVPDHALIYILSGKLNIVEADSQSIFKQGDTVFVRRNTLAKFTKYPDNNGQPFRSLSIFFKKSFLKDYLVRNNLETGLGDSTCNPVKIKKVASTPLMKTLFDSLYLYFDSGLVLGRELSEIKTREAIMLLAQIDYSLYQSLFNLTEPGKIDLEKFMCKNFMFNVPLETFAKMTGRSLSTFKRDFEKIFNKPPSRWLKKKRLEFAHYLIKEKHKTPSDVYLEVGFENLSHFSSSFKEVYGYNPSSLYDDPYNKVSLASWQ